MNAKLFNSMEFKTALVLLVMLTFISLVLLNYNEKRKLELMEEYNKTCIFLSDNLDQYINESLNITCSCYYEPVNTGDEVLDKYTRPVCSCDCLRDGVMSRIAVRAI